MPGGPSAGAGAEGSRHEAPKPPIEVGWVLAGTMGSSTRRSVERALRRFVELAGELWPEFSWRAPLVARPHRVQSLPAEPVALIDLGMAELDAARWDFAFVVTEAELRTYDKPFALGVSARSFGVAVLCTARLDPIRWSDGGTDSPELEHRLLALALHELGHLNDVPHSSDPSDFMFDLNEATDLDHMRALAPETCTAIREQLVEVADLRLEERLQTRSAARFYLHAAWTNRWQIARSVAKMQPWAFPLRLSRLTTAALSTMVVFLITAEAWELGMRQQPVLVLTLSLFALSVTSVYVMKRQRLIERLRSQRFSEQRVLGNVSMALAVTLGMATTYTLVFVVALLATQVIFDRVIIESWTGLRQSGVHPGHFIVLSGFIASVAILIGALGASFESEGYIRHVALVDEET